MDSEFVIIAGLGNPRRQYEGTRHNVGFSVIDELAEQSGLTRPVLSGKSMQAKGLFEGRKVILMKPLTYMNLSGEAVGEAVRYYKADPETSLIVISDDVNLPEGKLRLRDKGSAGGHNGLKSIIAHLGTDCFMRVRVGVGGKPDPDGDLAAHVLGHFSKESAQTMAEAEKRAAEAVRCILTDGFAAAQNRFNG